MSTPRRRDCRGGLSCGVVLYCRAVLDILASSSIMLHMLNVAELAAECYCSSGRRAAAAAWHWRQQKLQQQRQLWAVVVLDASTK